MNPTVGYFITMNPGYAGRAELPENLKVSLRSVLVSPPTQVLFRPCAMCVPDLRLISEIMLIAEGFLEASSLSRKFITLYKLCKELLSKQDHYDWGLRAIKSVLVVAGMLKRGDRERPEDQVLMRALRSPKKRTTPNFDATFPRDFNVPKIVADDTPVFLGLISDLFPNLDVPRKRDQEFEKAVKNAACDLKLQPEENFIMKIVQLEEILFVRHSVFVVGDAGTGKTQTWRTLFRTYQNLKKKPVYADLNPKVCNVRFISVFISMISISSYLVQSCLTFNCMDIQLYPRPFPTTSCTGSSTRRQGSGRTACSAASCETSPTCRARGPSGFSWTAT